MGPPRPPVPGTGALDLARLTRPPRTRRQQAQQQWARKHHLDDFPRAPVKPLPSGVGAVLGRLKHAETAAAAPGPAGPGSLLAAGRGEAASAVLESLTEAVEALTEEMKKKDKKQGKGQGGEGDRGKKQGPGGEIPGQSSRDLAKALSRGKQPGGGSEDIMRNIGRVVQIAELLA